MTDPLGLLQSPLPLQGTRPATGDKTHETSQAFEAVFLTQFVDQMMKTTGDTAFGGPQQAEMWRSFMSEAVAQHLVEQGGLGLSGSISQMINAYASSVSTTEGESP